MGGRDKERWIDIFFCAVFPLIALLLPTYFLFLKQSVPYPHFVSVRIGYQTATLPDWLLFWSRVWGAVLPLALLSFLIVPKSYRPFHLSAFLLFFLGNIILFQPIAWDNSKIFLYVYFALSGGIALLLQTMAKMRLGGKLIALLLCLVLMLTGVAELIAFWRVRDDAFQIQSSDDAKIVRFIRKNTKPTDLFLSAMDINNPALLAGRPLFLGFGGWMPNFGIDQTERERDLRAVFADEPRAPQIIQKWHIAYIYLSDNERHNWGANEAALRSRYAILYDENGRVIFKAQ